MGAVEGSHESRSNYLEGGRLLYLGANNARLSNDNYVTGNRDIRDLKMFSTVEIFLYTFQELLTKSEVFAFEVLAWIQKIS